MASSGVAPFDTTVIEKSVWLDGSADGFTRAASDFDDEDGKEFTLGTWFQLTEFGVTGALFCAGNGSGTYTSLRHSNDDKIYFQTEAGSAILSTPNLYRDIGWYHLLLSVDTTQAVSSNRVRLFINGEEVIFSGTQPSVNHAYEFNTAQIHEVGDSYENGAFEGYLAQSFMIGSKSIQQGDFAITDFLDTYTFGTNGSQFIPKKHSEIKTLVDAGSDNSFLLDYDPADPTASNALGLDTSSYGNNFTSTSMGSANQSVHTPSKVYSVFNPLAHADNSYPGTFTLSEGNTKNVLNSSNTSVKTTVPFVMSGSNIIRAQFTFSTIGDGGCGITGSSHTAGSYHTSADSIAGRGDVGLLGSGALVIDGNFNNSYTSALSNGDVVDVIVNCDVGAVYFAVNGTLLGGATQSEIQAGTTTNAALVSSFVRRTAGEVFNFYAFQHNPTSSTVEYNSGQSSFTNSYSTITSLKSLNTADLPAPDYQGIDYFDATIYEGNGTGQRVGDFVPFTDVGTISQSLVLNKDDQDRLTIASSVSTTPTNVQKKTISVWLKPWSVRENFIMVGKGSSSDTSERIYSNASGQIQYLTRDGSNSNAHVMTTGAFLADTSQWVHVVVALDYTDGSTEADRVKIYVNGVRQTDLAATTYPVNNMTNEAFINKASTEQIIGCHPDNTRAIDHSDMYYAEYYMVDGEQLDASVFGQLDTSTNRWVAKSSSTVTTAINALTDGFGNCGFYLDFSNNSDYGEDDSGKNRDWTENGVLDATNQFIDTPSSNFATIDPVISNGATPVTLSKGNLTGVRSASGFQQAYSNFSGFRLQENTGIYFAEVLMGADSSNFSVGVLSGDPPSSTNRYLGQDSNTYGYAYDSGNKVNNGTGASYGATYTSGDVIGIEIDTDTGSINFHKNGSDQGQAFTAVPGPYSFAFDTESGGGPNTFNFGQQMVLGGASTTFNATAGGRFKHTPPTGAKALNQDNLDDVASKLTVWSWIKNRDATDSHILVDRIRGVGKTITSDETSAAVQQTNMNTVQRFLQRGVQIGSDVTVNTANESYVLWQWLAGDSATTGSTTSPAGTIASTTIVADAGHFSVGSYTGNGTDNATVGHGLGAIPEMIIVRNLSRLTYGLLWHKDGHVDGGTGDPSEFVMDFARAINFAANNEKFGGSDETYPTANVFKIGDHNEINANTESLVFYAFRSVPGVCKVGVYHGNGNADGAYVSVGFRPKFVMIKSNRNARDFVVADTTRHPTNVVGEFLYPSSNAVESARGVTSGSDYDLDILSDGFKLRCADGALNDSTSGSNSYMYIAMAEIGGNGSLPPIYGR